jgi:hypothetical protein
MALRTFYLIFTTLPDVEFCKVWVSLGYVRLGSKYSRQDLFRFRFYSSHCIYRRRMCSYQHTAFTVFYRYDTLYTGHKSDASVGLGRRRRYLDWYGFRFSTTFWKVFVIELRDSVVFSVVQRVFSNFEIHCAYGFAHTFSHLYCLIRGWVLQGLGEFRLI